MLQQLFQRFYFSNRALSLIQFRVALVFRVNRQRPWGVAALSQPSKGLNERYRFCVNLVHTKIQLSRELQTSKLLDAEHFVRRNYNAGETNRRYHVPNK